MPRFFIDDSQIKGDTILLDEENSNHIAKVLRCRVGDKITVCNKNYIDYECSITEITKKQVVLNIIEKLENTTEPKIKVTLFQALPKQSKMELIIEKCVEIGISEITPIETKYCIAKSNDKKDNKKERWQKISETAAKQCNRGIIPKINDTININDLKDLTNQFDAFIVAYEKETELNIKNYISTIKDKDITNIGIIIGSEGGFCETEIEFLKSIGINSVSLTSRILRTETAPIYLLSILLYELEL